MARRGGRGIGLGDLLIGLLVWGVLTVSVTDPLAQWLGMSQDGEDRLFYVAFFGVPGMLIIVLFVGPILARIYRRRQEQERRKRLDEDLKRLEEEQKKRQEKDRQIAEEEYRKRLEEYRKRVEEEQRERLEKRRQIAEEERKRLDEQQRERQEEKDRQIAEERREREELRRQREEESRREEQERAEQIEALLERDAFRESVHYMSGVEFENFMANVFDKKGYNVKTTPATGDQGVDLLLTIDDRKVAVQLKRYTAPVGNGAIQAVVAGMFHYKAKEAWVITTSSFTKSAVELAKSNRVRLIDGRELEDWMSDLREET